MNKRPTRYDDWEQLNKHTSYTKQGNLWWSTQENTKGEIYDELSANHNGIIGYGRQFLNILNGIKNQENFNEKIRSNNRDKKSLPK